MTKKDFFKMLNEFPSLYKLEIQAKQFETYWNGRNAHISLVIARGKTSVHTLQSLHCKHYGLLTKGAQKTFTDRVTLTRDKYKKWFEEYKRRQPGIVRIV